MNIDQTLQICFTLFLYKTPMKPKKRFKNETEEDTLFRFYTSKPRKPITDS